MKRAFGDSFYFLALFNRNDAAHADATTAAKSLEGILVTTDWILTEVADALSAPENRVRCAELIEDLRRSKRVEIVECSRRLFDSGWKLYRARDDKSWSLTDCISFIVMQENSITDALTGDRHFEQAGFRALLRQG